MTGSSLNTSSTSTLGITGSSIDASTLGSSGSSINASKPENESKQEPVQAGQDNGLPNNLENTTSVDLSSGGIKADKTAHSQRRLLQENDSKETSHSKDEAEMQAASVDKEGLEEDVDASFDLFRDAEDLADQYNYDYDDYVDPAMWGDEEWTEGKHEKLEDYVNVDSHILCTPVIADIDNDSIQEMIVAVSYFDPENGSHPTREETMQQVDIIGKEFIYHMDPEVTVMKKANISGWRWRR